MASATWEKTWPPLLAVVAASVAAVVLTVLLNIKPLPLALPAATMTFGIVVAGFAATQRNMLLTMSGSEVLRFARTTGYYEDIISYLTNGIHAGLLVTLISLCGFFLGENCALWTAWLSVLTGGVALVLGLTARNEMLSNRLVRRFLEEQPKP